MPVIKRHNGFRLNEMKSGKLYVGSETVSFRIIKSLGRKYLVLENEAIRFENFDELFSKLKNRGIRVIIAYDKFGKGHATILL
jgi:5-methylcytosine-specific restriction endonuclease McrBC GTP-binding regulatory subunit McrB